MSCTWVVVHGTYETIFMASNVKKMVKALGTFWSDLLKSTSPHNGGQIGMLLSYSSMSFESFPCLLIALKEESRLAPYTFNMVGYFS